MKGVIAIFVLPHEIENLSATLISLKRNSIWLGREFQIKIEITLSVSAEFTDWQKSRLPADFFIERTVELCRCYCDWCDFGLYIEVSKKIISRGLQFQKVFHELNDTFFFVWLDTNTVFHDYTLSCLLGCFKTLTSYGFSEIILTPQTTKRSDSDWLFLVNKKLQESNSNQETLYSDILCASRDLNLCESPILKFDSGLFTLISGKLLQRTGFPDSIAKSNLESEYISKCCSFLRSQGVGVYQFIIENLIVGRGEKYLAQETIKKFLANIDVNGTFEEIDNELVSNEFRLFAQNFTNQSVVEK